MKDPTVGLALGSGGARGFAHLGVLKVLHEANIPVHCIAGSSMGALVAAFYATGMDMDRLYKIANAFKRKYHLDVTVPKMGFVVGERIKELVRVFTHGKNIEDLMIPIAIVTTDLRTGEKVVFREGPVAEAVRASISIPGIFVPEPLNGRLLVDGGVVDRIPVSVARDLGADIVIAVDVSRVKTNAEIGSIFDVILQSLDILQEELVKHREIASDVMIRPHVEAFSSRAFKNIAEIIAIGEEEGRKHLPKIKATIENWKEQHHEKE
ncbi:patatin-like phospholipase family protein [Priestia koreensis]|uniref:patatin-like phospholipase family protein n=1 Tax=Priestia koreensis TaxID=284581 RepID=UPI001F573E1B|nr:patatin-like phospholipase family protein [Priestia koreensis]MCM3003887.1 patatin-like phospholipase family protein [Priestia koreensis]UNL83987.1 patatin-like phospholipase family protein [Priestia koreensis]